MMQTREKTYIMHVQHRILLANHDSSVADFFAEALLSEGYAVHQTHTLSNDGASWCNYDLLIFGLQPTTAEQTVYDLVQVHAQHGAQAAVLVCCTSPVLLEQLDVAQFKDFHSLVLPCFLEDFYEAVATILS